MVSSLQSASINYQVKAEKHLNKDFNLNDNYLAKSIRLIKNFSICWKAQQTPELAKAYSGIINLARKVKVAHSSYKWPDMLAPSPSGSSSSSHPKVSPATYQVHRDMTATGFFRYGAIYLHWLQLGLHEREGLSVAIAGPGIVDLPGKDVSPQVYETARFLNGAAITVLDKSWDVLNRIRMAPPTNYSYTIRKLPESNIARYFNPEIDKVITLLSTPASRECSLEFQQFDFLTDRFAPHEKFDLIVATSSLYYPLAVRQQLWNVAHSYSPSESHSFALTTALLDKQYELVEKFLYHLNDKGVLYLEQKAMQCLCGKKPEEHLDTIASTLERKLDNRSVAITLLPMPYGTFYDEEGAFFVFNDLNGICGIETQNVYAITVSHHACRGP